MDDFFDASNSYVNEFEAYLLCSVSYVALFQKCVYLFLDTSSSPISLLWRTLVNACVFMNARRIDRNIGLSVFMLTVV